MNISATDIELLLISSMLLASKTSEYYSVGIKAINSETDNKYTQQQIVNMEISILIALDFNIIFPSCVNFSDYLISNKTDKKVENLMYNIMAVIMTNFNWSYGLTQYEIAQSAIDITSKLLGLKDNFCLRKLKHGKILTVDEIEEYLLSVKPTPLSKEVLSYISK